MKKVKKFIEPSKLRNGSKPIYYSVDENGCHNCVSHKAEPAGYFQITRNGIRMRMHRYIYLIINGQIPEDKLVRHKCNNPNCINPEHLEIGTQKDNMEDMKRSNKPKKKRKVLTKEEIVQIITDCELTNEQLAKKFDVTVRTIYNIKSKYRDSFRTAA